MSKLSPKMRKSLDNLIQLKENEIRRGKDGSLVETSKYPYLVFEDARFAKAFRLSEDEVLEMFGGLKGYSQHRLDRDKARNAGYEVPALSDNLEEHLESLKFTDTSEKQFATYLAGEQKEKIAGCLSAIKAEKEFEAEAKRETERKAAEKEYTINALCKEASGKFGVSPDSQTAKDWADQQYKIRSRQRF